MKSAHFVFSITMILLVALTACGPVGTATLEAKPTSTPTTPPPLVQAPLNVAPACIPPAPSISNVNSFCANVAAGLGGATWDQNPSDSDPSVAKDAAFFDDFSNPDCTWNQNKVACSGPQNGKVTYAFCTSCGAPNSVEPQAYDATYGPNVCANGYVKNNGACVPVDPNKPFGLCPSGSHYDNALQNCADDVTNQLASPCPPGYPYYIPADRLCLAKAYPIVYDCQAFTLTLGDCSLQQKKPEAGGSKSCSSYGDQTSCEAHPCRWISGACQTP